MLLFLQIRSVALSLPLIESYLRLLLKLLALKFLFLAGHDIGKVIADLKLVASLQGSVEALFIYFENLKRLLLDLVLRPVDLLAPHNVQSFVLQQLKCLFKIS